EFEGGLARCPNLLRIGDHGHPLGGWHRARGPKTSPPLELDDAKEARTRRLKPLHIAKRWNGNPGLARRLQNRLPRLNLHREVIDSQRNESHGRAEGKEEIRRKAQGRNPKSEECRRKERASSIPLGFRF